MAHPIYDLEVETLTGETTTLSDLRGKVALIVNTASQCGFTPQYEGLEKLYRRYRERGFVVLGFPCNQFGRQEPGSADQIADFCERRFQVSFPMYAKVDVNGPNAHPLFVALKRERPGLFGQRIKWNFTKFLVDGEGRVVRRFGSMATPASIERHVSRLLSTPAAAE